jgi:hypothetical protein
LEESFEALSMLYSRAEKLQKKIGDQDLELYPGDSLHLKWDPVHQVLGEVNKVLQTMAYQMAHSDYPSGGIDLLTDTDLLVSLLEGKGVETWMRDRKTALSKIKTHHILSLYSKMLTTAEEE